MLIEGSANDAHEIRWQFWLWLCLLGVISVTYLSRDKTIHYQLQYIGFAYLMKLSAIYSGRGQACNGQVQERFHKKETKKTAFDICMCTDRESECVWMSMTPAEIKLNNVWINGREQIRDELEKEIEVNGRRLFVCVHGRVRACWHFFIFYI